MTEGNKPKGIGKKGFLRSWLSEHRKISGVGSGVYSDPQVAAKLTDQHCGVPAPLSGT